MSEGGFFTINPGDRFTDEDKSSIAFKRDALCVDARLVGEDEQEIIGVSEGLRGPFILRHSRYGPKLSLQIKGIGSLSSEQEEWVDRITCNGDYRKKYCEEMIRIMREHQVVQVKGKMDEQKRMVDLMVTLIGQPALHLKLLEALLKKRGEYDPSFRVPTTTELLTKIFIDGIGLELMGAMKDMHMVMNMEQTQTGIQKHIQELLEDDQRNQWRT
jgi:hypothetical protein